MWKGSLEAAGGLILAMARYFWGWNKGWRVGYREGWSDEQKMKRASIKGEMSNTTTISQSWTAPEAHH
jgi:hypothetical protein